MELDYLVIGHVTEDVTPAGRVPGGSALYAALTAQRLGRRVAVVTSAPAALRLEERLPGVLIHRIESAQATTFENRYSGDQRRQHIHHVAPAIGLTDVPDEWRRARIVHLAPIAQEVEPALLGAFPNSLLCVTPQGWLRGWEGMGGAVQYVPLARPHELLRPVDVLVLSAEDVAHDPAVLRQLIRAVPIAVITEAANGAIVHTRDGARPSPARPATVVDPTGAGDVFAAAFFVRLYERGDPYEAAAFANVVASFAIEQRGSEGIPTRGDVEQWFARAARG